MMQTPNLFSYATSELSQDAFICWLLEWSDPKNKKSDIYLHQCGEELLKSFFLKSDIEYPKELKQIEIFKQFKNIDVLAILNKEYAIIIEDKTNTGNHSNQLKRYLKIVEREGYNIKKIIPIYFKTYDQSNYKDVLDKNYNLFLRKDFLNILNNYTEIKNNIFLEFKSHLQSIEDRVNSFKKYPIEEWNWYSWIGFYKEIKSNMNTDYCDCDWAYVPNKGGGFLGLWWNFREKDKYTLHLQFEQEKLCFKIRVDDKEKRSHLRNLLSKEICEISNEFDLSFNKPKRFGKGLHMTVAVLNEDARKVDENGEINISETLKILDQCNDLMNKIIINTTYKKI